MANTQLKTLMCLVCGFIYDENSGISADSIAPGICRADLPPDRTCPDREAGSDDFKQARK
jgi:rubredoxin